MKNKNRNHSLSRRQFVKTTAKGAALIGAGLATPYIAGCTEKEEYDLVVFGGRVYDGLGNPGIEADIAIKNDRIYRIAPGLKTKWAKQVIDARGYAVSPGFIDPHTHSDTELIANRKAESYIRQGVTTEVGGNCGISYFPIPDALSLEWRRKFKNEWDVDMDWDTMNGFFSRLSDPGIAYNFASLVGHGSIRGKARGLGNGPPTDQEMEEMKQHVRDAMEAGAVGMSTGLEYLPGIYARKDELIELCRIVAQYGGVYATHMRSEGTRLIQALDEAISIARETGISLEISHFKVDYPVNWPKIDEALQMIENARMEGIRIEVDRYPYTAGSTGLALYFPMWAKVGSRAECIARLEDPNNHAKLGTALDTMGAKLGSWEKVIIASVKTEENRIFQGKNIIEAAGSVDKEVNTFMRELMIEEGLQVDMITFMMDEDNTRRILAHPLTSIGSDSSARAPYGPLSKTKPHPRSYGTFPRVLGKYVREENLLSLSEAIRKMTSKTAMKFGIRERGQLKENYFADITIFNPDTVIDKATWSDPHQYPEGIDYVIVNGELVINEGEHTGKLPGKALRKT